MIFYLIIGFCFLDLFILFLCMSLSILGYAVLITFPLNGFCLLYKWYTMNFQVRTLDPKAVNDETCTGNTSDGNNTWYTQ